MKAQQESKVQDINELRRLRRKQNKKPSMSRYLFLLTACLALLLYGLTQLFTIREILVEGNSLYTKEQIVEILKIDKDTNVVEVYMNTHQKFEDYPYIDRVEIKYLSYDSIKIIVHEKQIIGYIEAMDIFLCIDKDGYIVDQKKKEALDPNIVVIEGLKADALVMGERLNLPQDTIDTCLRFYQAGKKYAIPMQRIKFADGDLDRIQIISQYLTIEFGSRDNFEQKVQFIEKMLVQMPENEYGILSLDEDGKSGFYQKKDTQI